ncbi:MAG: type II toxin-antitoxin system HicB family antitoxin [Dehalococcoidia bacterium]|nr:type II toxin-antitoxin system HicB family antitoxin [Dehalococcoidia bacterium]
MKPRQVVYATVRPDDESGYVAECPELHVVTQGETLDETAGNLQEAIALALDDGDFEELGFVPEPAVAVRLND